MDGGELTGPPEAWAGWRAEGVDHVAVATHVGTTQMAAQSVYWLYAEGSTWILGGAPAGYGLLPPEIVIHPDGRQLGRPLEFMPDLWHAAVKLGHWWPGTENQPWQ